MNQTKRGKGVKVGAAEGGAGRGWKVRRAGGREDGVGRLSSFKHNQLFIVCSFFFFFEF